MSRIDDLIQQHCPDGVEYRALGEVAGYSTDRISADQVSADSFVGVDNLLPDRGGRTPSQYVPSKGNLTRYEPGDVLLGNIRPYLRKIWLADNSGGCSGDVLAIRPLPAFRDAIMPAYLYEVLASNSFFDFSTRHSKGGKMPRGSKPMNLRFQVPVPPLEVQGEIVRILDTFSELEAELEAELAARRKQYEYYRDKLLTFDELPADASTPADASKGDTAPGDGNAMSDNDGGSSP